MQDRQTIRDLADALAQSGCDLASPGAVVRALLGAGFPEALVEDRDLWTRLVGPARIRAVGLRLAERLGAALATAALLACSMGAYWFGPDCPLV